MFPRGHSGIGMILNSILIALFTPSPILATLGTISIITASVIPDIDMVSYIRIGHREATHTLIFCLVLTAVSSVAFYAIEYFKPSLEFLTLYASLAVLIGSLSHILSDSMNSEMDIGRYTGLEITVGGNYIESDSAYYNNLLFVAGFTLNVASVIFFF